jgi:hypothetical protein
MSVFYVLMQRTMKLGLVLMLGASISACSSTTRWKEEVLLHDGQIIVSERFYHLGGYPAIESHNRAPLDEIVTFNLPNSKSIVWKNDFRDSEPEPNSLNLIRFDVVKGVPYIATYPAGCIAYNKWGRPNPPQVLFKYENEQWRRITLAELPEELINTQANVIVGRPDVRILRPFYNVESVNNQNYDIHTPEYKTILREAVPNYGKSCGEMVYDGNGGWIGIGWFSKQPSKEACFKYCEREKMSVQYCPCETLFKGK